MTDWVAWHADYDDPASALTQRLGVVQSVLDEAVASHEGSRLRVLGVCAGDGRDVLPVLARWRERKEIVGRLIELEPHLAEQARTAARRAGLHGIEALCGDAGRMASYAGAIPADLLVVCGVFGNLSDDDVERLVRVLSTMCAERANVVWTRHRRAPDLTPRIRSWFASNGFAERAFVSPGPDRFSVGRHELVDPQPPASFDDPLFRFVR